MIFQQIRNATIKLKYAGKFILFDPWLAPKESQRAVESPDEEKNKVKNPTVDLPISIEEIIKDVDVCIITHIHIDHFDEESMSKLKKDIKVYVQNERDLEKVKNLGFNDIEILSAKGSNFGDITIYKTECQHGETPETTAGPASGVILKSDFEKTTYVAGDTIWYEKIENTIKHFKPEVIIINACEARLKKGRLLMDLSDIEAVYKAAGNAKIIVSHLDAVNHAFITRTDVRKMIVDGKMKSIYVPDDGEKLAF